MAENFEDVVKKLGDTIKKPAAAKAAAVLAVQMVDSKGKVIKEEEGESAAEAKREEEKRGKKTNTILTQIAQALGGKDGPSKEDKKLGGMFGGIGRAIGGLGKGVGVGIGGFMKGIGAAGAGALKFSIAFPLFGVGIAGFIAAFAVIAGGATWAISKMMPSIAEGLKEFEEVDGKNLINVGAGMGALGAGFAAMGAGGAIKGVGNLIGGIAEGLGGLFGAESGQEALIEKLKKFSALKLNVQNIKDNTEAMVAYGIAMTAGGAGTAMEAIGKFAAGTLGKFGELFGAVPVLDSLKIFAKETIDKDKVKNNAEAMVEYTKAMALGAGASGLKALDSLANFVTTGVDGLSKMMGGEGGLDSMISGLQKMSAATGIDK